MLFCGDSVICAAVFESLLQSCDTAACGRLSDNRNHMQIITLMYPAQDLQRVYYIYPSPFG